MVESTNILQPSDAQRTLEHPIEPEERLLTIDTTIGL